MSRSLYSSQGFEYKYAPNQPSNVVWLPRKTKVGHAFFFLKLAIAYEDGEDEVVDFDALAKEYGVVFPHDVIEFGQQLPSKVFDSFLLLKSELTKAVNQLQTVAKTRRPIEGVGLHGFGGARFMAKDFPTLLTFVNKGLPKTLKLSESAFERANPKSSMSEFQQPHLPQTEPVKAAYEYLCAKPEKSIESCGHRALTLLLLHDGWFWGCDELRICDSDLSYAKSFSVLGRVPPPRFAHNGFHQTPTGWVL